MAHIIRNGRAGHVRITSLAAFFFIFTFSFSASGQTCAPSSTTPIVHAEGLAELIGSMVITCTGGMAGSTVTSSVVIQIPVNITNRLDSGGNLLNAGFSATGSTVLVTPPVLS